MGIRLPSLAVHGMLATVAAVMLICVWPNPLRRYGLLDCPQPIATRKA